MKKKLKIVIPLFMALLFVFVGGTPMFAANFEPNSVLGSTNWEGTFVYDAKGNDVTDKNSNFIGRAKYDATTNRYEFFDKKTNEPRGDRGVFFITQDGKKRILMSQSANYNAVVDMVRLDKEKFTYRRNGVQKDNSQGYVFVEHVPYAGELQFTENPRELTQETGVINKSIPGRNILASTFWQGTVAKDAAGNDVSAYNSNYLGLARYDNKTGRYEFFNSEGESRGDFGYFDVINGNKERTHYSLGRYAATLELTELNKDRFTYQRNGKDADGNDILITVEHEPYKGTHSLDFTFGNETTGPIVMPPIKTDKTDELNSNAVVEVESEMFAGTVKFSETANIDASILFNKLDVKDKPTSVDEKEKGKAQVTVVDTRKDNTTNGEWNVKVKLDNGPFGNQAFLLNNLGIRLLPTTEDPTIKLTNSLELVDSVEKTAFLVGYQEGNLEEKRVTLNPQLIIGNFNNLQTGLYGTNVIWTLTPQV